ncbi:MAG: thioesterase family protein [Candidatus Binatia bacterium]|nr:thioesterase family protein [Candidatus Binatia bacterium]
MTTELQVLHETTVGPEEIDHLGHMNVRFYAEKAVRATRALVGQMGLTPEWCAGEGSVLELRGSFTRHYREQMKGARLVVQGGVLDVRADGLRLYHELLNPERGERAATFVHDMGLCDERTRALRPIPEMVADRAAKQRVEWPEHGRPRTVDLSREPRGLSLEEARTRGIAMREVRELREDECTDAGFFPAVRYGELVWGGVPLPDRSGFMPLQPLEGGGQFGWAILESRGILRRLPCAGTRIQSFGTEVQVGRKTSYRHSWVFDVDSGDVLCMSSTVDIAFDTGARRAIEIPAAARKRLESQCHPDLL